MTKAAKIREMYAAGRSVNDIAEIVECLPEYVRVVARQRTYRGQSAADRKYRGDRASPP